jgi:hypothetical protein
MPETQTTENKPTLTLQDLNLIVEILETGSQRGAWKADELSTIGGVYDRISAFLNVANAAQKPLAPTASEEQQ